MLFIAESARRKYNLTGVKQRGVARSQGGESRDFLRLFYICVQTERVRKLFIIVFILNFYNAITCIYLVFIRSYRLFKCFMLLVVFFHATLSKEFRLYMES